MEEIGYRTDIFSLDGIAGSQREYLYWLIGACAADGTDAELILTEEAIDLLVTKLRTPLQQGDSSGIAQAAARAGFTSTVTCDSPLKRLSAA